MTTRPNLAINIFIIQCSHHLLAHGIEAHGGAFTEICRCPALGLQRGDPPMSGARDRISAPCVVWTWPGGGRVRQRAFNEGDARGAIGGLRRFGSLPRQGFHYTAPEAKPAGVGPP